MPDATYRYMKWANRFDPTREGNESLSPLMKSLIEKLEFTATVRDKFQKLVNLEDSVRSVLNGQNIATIYYPFYFAFARQVWAMKQKGIDGDSLRTATAALIAKWVSRGLTQTVLELIRDAVFAIGEPPTS